MLKQYIVDIDWNKYDTSIDGLINFAQFVTYASEKAEAFYDKVKGSFRPGLVVLKTVNAPLEDAVEAAYDAIADIKKELDEIKESVRYSFRALKAITEHLKLQVPTEAELQALEHIKAQSQMVELNRLIVAEILTFMRHHDNKCHFTVKDRELVEVTDLACNKYTLGPESKLILELKEEPFSTRVDLWTDVYDIRGRHIAQLSDMVAIASAYLNGNIRIEGFAWTPLDHFTSSK